MDYISTDSIPYFKDCASLVEQVGYTLVELQVVPQHGMTSVTVVIAPKNSNQDIGVSDCSKVHHAILPSLISILHKSEDDLNITVCSPGIERNIKNAAEFAFFVGKHIRVWDKTISDWVNGVIVSSSDKALVLEKEGGVQQEITYENIAKAKFLHL